MCGQQGEQQCDKSLRVLVAFVLAASLFLIAAIQSKTFINKLLDDLGGTEHICSDILAKQTQE